MVAWIVYGTGTVHVFIAHRHDASSCIFYVGHVSTCVMSTKSTEVDFMSTEVDLMSTVLKLTSVRYNFSTLHAISYM